MADGSDASGFQAAFDRLLDVFIEHKCRPFINKHGGMEFSFTIPKPENYKQVEEGLMNALEGFFGPVENTQSPYEKGKDKTKNKIHMTLEALAYKGGYRSGRSSVAGLQFQQDAQFLVDAVEIHLARPQEMLYKLLDSDSRPGIKEYLYYLSDPDTKTDPAKKVDASIKTDSSFPRVPSHPFNQSNYAIGEVGKILDMLWKNEPSESNRHLYRQLEPKLETLRDILVYDRDYLSKKIELSEDFAPARPALRWLNQTIFVIDKFAKEINPSDAKIAEWKQSAKPSNIGRL